jgi:hypothetical protein
VSRYLLDTGALIALARDDVAMWSRLAGALRDGIGLVTHGGVLGQSWRHARQARLARALRAIDVKPLDAAVGRSAGELLAKARMSDVVDAALIVLSRTGDKIYTSDPDDLLLLAEVAGRDVEIIPV